MLLQSNLVQPNLFENEGGTTKPRSSTFSDNTSLAIHRWFKYSAGFSARWVAETIRNETRPRKEMRVLDPFAGSGTVLVESNRLNVASYGIESHPFVARIAHVKTRTDVSADDFNKYANKLLNAALEQKPKLDHYPPLIRNCFPDEPLGQLDQLRSAWIKTIKHPCSEYGWLIIASILRQCSPVGTANWQYVLPRKSKSRIVEPLKAFLAKASTIECDLRHRKLDSAPATLIQGDAREKLAIPDKWATLVITSPPYPNNFDYADATRLEMTFFGDIEEWGDLQDSVRTHLVRSCTQHVSPIVKDTFTITASKELASIADELIPLCKEMETERLNHGGKKNYHTMIAAYFLDMAKVWIQLRRITAKGGRVCYVIGDSAPYGIYVPVDKWMASLALSAGFRSTTFEKTRDRNIKWKNRKHRVPLKEGRLWVEG